MNILSLPRAKTPKWFDIQKASADSADVYLYDIIGDPWTGTDAKAVVAQLDALKTKKINLRINSPGGYVNEGNAIYNALRRHPAEVTTYIDGMAASIASVVAMAGRRIIMAANSTMMIHDPWTIIAGNSRDLVKEAAVLDKLKETIVGTYVARTGIEGVKVAQMMADETWFTAQEAVAQKFADEVLEEVRAAACTIDLAPFGYRRASVVTTDPGPIPSPRTTPRSLLERRQALLEKHNH